VTAAVIEWKGGVGGPVELPVLAPLGQDGLLLARPFGPGPAGSVSTRRPGVLLVPRRLLVRFALDIVSGHPEVGPVAVWPAGVPATWTAVALAFGDLLGRGRPPGSAPVVCAGDPPTRKTRPTIRHQVRAEIGGRPLGLSVWEIQAFACSTSTLLATARAA
jgi:hypothetical protein